MIQYVKKKIGRYYFEHINTHPSKLKNLTKKPNLRLSFKVYNKKTPINLEVQDSYKQHLPTLHLQ